MIENISLAYMRWFIDFIEIKYWVILSVLLLTLGLIGLSPLSSEEIEPNKQSTRKLLFILLRRNLYMLITSLLVVLPVLFILVGTNYYGTEFTKYNKEVSDLLFIKYKEVWEFPIIGYLLGWSISIIYCRNIRPYISSISRKFTIRQSGDELTDIRVLSNVIKTKNYEPKKYYKDNNVFLGLDDNSKPIYLSMENWKTQNQRIVGPTQTGKGVEIGLQLDQAIRCGSTVFFIDSKPDGHAKAIMGKACKETGRNFISLNFNKEETKYAPCLSGSPRERRGRLIALAGLIDTGEQADFYKSGERKILDEIFDSWDGHLRTLKNILNTPGIKEETERTQNYIAEYLRVKSFDTTDSDPGFSIPQVIKNKSVVHVQGNLDDTIINNACTLFITELMEQSKHTFPFRENHIFISVDEVAFLISEKIADALATIAGFNTSMMLAYQSEGDLLNLRDKTLNAKAISHRVKTNTKISLYYLAADFDTATTVAEESGTIQKSVSRSQRVKAGRHLSETWGDERDVHDVEENLITTNDAKMLPDRVGILYRPNQLAIRCYTSWIKVNIKEEPLVYKQKLEVATKLENNEEVNQKESNLKIDDIDEIIENFKR